MTEKDRQRPLPMDAESGTVPEAPQKPSTKPDAGAPSTRRQVIHEAADAVSDHIRRQPHVQRLFSFMPSLMTRVSPFHFRARTRTKDWPLVRLDSGEGSAWGRMAVVGELLVIFDETVLLCLLSLMNRYGSDVFETSCGELCDLAMIQPTAGACRDVWKSVQRLAGTRIDLELLQGRGRARRAVKAMTGSILSYGDMERKSEVLRVVINPYFLEMYAESFVTNIDLRFRSSLKSDVTRALYRFYQGQLQADSVFDLSRIARSVNLPADDARAAARKLRTALHELADRGYLESFSVSGDGRVSVKKSKETAVNVDRQILGADRFHISRIAGPGKDLER
jgi:hypothetical protein